MSTVPISGSERHVMRSAKDLGPARQDERFEVTIRLRRVATLPASALDGTRRSKDRAYLTHAQLEARHGAAPADIAKVEAFARTAGLAVVQVSPARRSVVLSGTVAAFQKAFAVDLRQYEHPTRGSFRGRTGPVHIPKELDKIVEGVF